MWATITGIYSIHQSPHSEFKGVDSVRKSLNNEVEKFMNDAKVLSSQNGIVFNKKIMYGEIGYNIIKLAQGKGKFSMIVIGSRGRRLQNNCSLEVYQTMLYTHLKFQ